MFRENFKVNNIVTFYSWPDGADIREVGNEGGNVFVVWSRMGLSLEVREIRFYFMYIQTSCHVMFVRFAQMAVFAVKRSSTE